MLGGFGNICNFSKADARIPNYHLDETEPFGIVQFCEMCEDMEEEVASLAGYKDRLRWPLEKKS